MDGISLPTEFIHEMLSSTDFYHSSQKQLEKSKALQLNALDECSQEELRIANRYLDFFFPLPQSWRPRSGRGEHGTQLVELVRRALVEPGRPVALAPPRQPVESPRVVGREGEAGEAGGEVFSSGYLPTCTSCKPFFFCFHSCIC